AFVNGTVLVLDVPSRQQLTYRMVGRESLPNAIALNSSLFNASRIFGPSVAGILLGFAGVGVCFLVNAVSFLAVLLGLFAMRTRDFFPLEEFERPRVFAGTREGLAYVRSQPRMLAILGLTVVLSTFCFNFNVTLPVLAKITLHGHGTVYGFLSAVFGAGALAGALVAASRARASMRVMVIGALVFTGAELLLAPAGNQFVAGLLLFLVGAGFTAWSANSNASMQLAASPAGSAHAAGRSSRSPSPASSGSRGPLRRRRHCAGVRRSGFRARRSTHKSPRIRLCAKSASSTRGSSICPETGFASA